MKKPVSASREVPKVSERRSPRTERAREPIARAQQVIGKADALLGDATPRTVAERHLAAQRAKLVTWLKRFGLLGAIAAGNAGLFAGAEYAGNALHDGAVAIGNGIRSLGDIHPIQVEFVGSDNVNLDQEDVPHPDPGYVSWPEQGTVTSEITINDPEDPFATVDGGTDATVHQESEYDRQQRIARESALLLADQLEAEGFFNQAHTASDIMRLLEARMREMGFTSGHDFETARLIVQNRARELVHDRADENIEDAMRMADRVNESMGGVDRYALALEHHRPDLAASVASDSIHLFAQDVRDLQRDPEYAHDPEGRVRIASESRSSMLYSLLGDRSSDDIAEVARHLSRSDKRELASALDAEIASLEAYTNEFGDEHTPRYIQDQLARLRASRQVL